MKDCPQEGPAPQIFAVDNRLPTITKVSSWLSCSELCREEDKCQYWTWIPDTEAEKNLDNRRKCLLYTKRSGPYIINSTATTGMRSCGLSK